MAGNRRKFKLQEGFRAQEPRTLANFHKIWLEPLQKEIAPENVYFDTKNVRAACLQNETAPEKVLNQYEKRFEKREKRSEKRSETRLKNV